jgi:micrococcal nuclease
MRARILVVAAVSALAAGCAAPVTDGDPPAGAALLDARVERVVDGDTLVARAGGARFRVRLLGIDTPESVAPDRPVECFGPEAARETERLLPPGTRVRLETDPTQDRVDDFGRLLAYVIPRAGGPPVNQRLVREGYAEVYVYRGREFRRLPAFAAAERTARAEGRGLWGRCAGAAATPEPASRSGRECPPGRPVKGNLPSGIYHLPGQPSYEATNPERCFASAEEAEKAGFRAPRG